ncbi:MAG: hypothetical protein MJZ46_03095 [Bacteroidales bacterium]|nr:hypothetical protein [Bacteroidales bacterium]
MAEKKTAMIADKINEELSKGTSLQDIATKYTSQVMDSVALTFLAESYMNRNIEDVAIAKIFNIGENSTKAVAGQNYVYVANVSNFTDNPASANYAAEKAALRNVVAGRGRNEATILQGLRKNAKIVDQRNMFYAK